MSLLSEGAEYRGESGKTYLAVSPLGQANVWTAVDKDEHGNIVVLKAPASDDTGASWPHFQHEMIMHELLKDCSAIRRQVDRIPPVSGDNTPPILVLEIFGTTLWSARTKRPFTKGEVKAVAKQILQGLHEVHEHGLVYADLKMQNVMVNGFDNAEPGDGSDVSAKLGDLGIVMYPSNGKVQPVAYRAPEVYFKGEITQAADMWAFGLIYCHLLGAQCRFHKTGMYDDLYTGTGSMPEREQAMRYALANDHGLEDVEYYHDCALPYRSGDHEVGQQWEELSKRGLDQDDIELLQWVLKADPRERPSAHDVITSRWFSAGAEKDEPVSALPQNDRPTDHKRQSLGESKGSCLRERRDANSKTSASLQMPAVRPEALIRGASQVVFTPGVASEVSQNASLMQHPLLQAAVRSAATNARGSYDESRAVEAADGRANDDAPSGPAGNSADGLDRNGAAEKESEDRASVEGVQNISSGAATADLGTEANKSPERPNHLAHIGKQSSSGGTWLSYK